jgi:hypothetical protein
MWILGKEAALLLCVALALTPAFKMKFWNLGGEGQIMIGALATAACMIYLGESLPEPALMIGRGRSEFDKVQAMCSASPFSCVRIIIKSKYELKVRIESSFDSPLNSDEVAASRTSATFRPII